MDHGLKQIIGLNNHAYLMHRSAALYEHFVRGAALRALMSNKQD